MEKRIPNFNEFVNENYKIPRLDPEMIELLNYRANQEELSSRIYQAMYLWMVNEGFEGAATLYKEYYEEELEHAGWVYDHLLSLNIKPTLRIIDVPQLSFTGLPEIL